MPCQAIGRNVAPSCKGPMTATEDDKGLIFCPTCKRIRREYFAGVERMRQRNTARVQFTKDLLSQQGLTGTSLQKQITARTEQVIIESFQDACEGRLPADF